MAVVVIAGLIFRRSLKTMPDNQPQFKEQVERIIQSCPTDGEVHLICQPIVQLLQRKMSVDTINGFQDGIAFWRLAMIVHLKIVIQDTLHSGQSTYFHPISQKPHKGTYFQADKRKSIYKNSKLACFNALLTIRSYTSPSSAKRWTLAIAAFFTGRLPP